MKLFLAVFFFHSMIPLLIVAELFGAPGAKAALQGSFIALLVAAPFASRLMSKNRSSKELFTRLPSWFGAAILMCLWWTLKIPFAIGLGMPLIGSILWYFIKGDPSETGR